MPPSHTVSASTQLFMAIANEDLEEVKWLLRNNPKAARSVFDPRDRAWMPTSVESHHLTHGPVTPLAFAVGHASYASELLELLIPVSDLSYKDRDGVPLLLLALSRLSDKHCQLLVSTMSHEEVTASTPEGFNGLMRACVLGDRDKTAILLEDGRLDVRQRMKGTHKEALDLALENNRQECVGLLVKKAPELIEKINHWVEQRLNSLFPVEGGTPLHSRNRIDDRTMRRLADNLRVSLYIFGEWLSDDLVLRMANGIEPVVGLVARQLELNERIQAIREKEVLRELLGPSLQRRGGNAHNQPPNELGKRGLRL